MHTPHTHNNNNNNKVYGKREKQRRLRKSVYANAQRKCLGLPPDAAAGLRFSPVHWHPEYVRNHPKGLERKPVLLEPSEAAKYGMVTIWNKVSTEYDDTPKVMAIPNYLGVIRGKHAYVDVRARSTSRPTSWSVGEDENDPLPDPLHSFETQKESDARQSQSQSDVVEFCVPMISPPLDIENGGLDGAGSEEVCFV